MITKELLSEVLNLNIVDYYQELDYIYYQYYIEGTCYIKEEDINIYQLVFKYKEWAFNKGYHIFVYKVKDYLYEFIITDNNNILMLSYEIPTEYEAIFKACKWLKKYK